MSLSVYRRLVSKRFQPRALPCRTLPVGALCRFLCELSASELEEFVLRLIGTYEVGTQPWFLALFRRWLSLASSHNRRTRVINVQAKSSTTTCKQQFSAYCVHTQRM